ncbi:hypothetical protein EDB86DRAFT_2833947 [Lactarius hatsudake]|nr:hypothetical protein EDB86DRAFT_2833947 [Lactarius hatsudake]
MPLKKGAFCKDQTCVPWGARCGFLERQISTADSAEDIIQWITPGNYTFCRGGVQRVLDHTLGVLILEGFVKQTNSVAASSHVFTSQLYSDRTFDNSDRKPRNKVFGQPEIYCLSAFSPAKVIFAGFGVLLAEKDVAGSRQDALVDLFELTENFFKRLETYTDVPPTEAMTRK